MKLSRSTIVRLAQIVFQQIHQTEYNTSLTLFLASLDSDEEDSIGDYKIKYRNKGGRSKGVLTTEVSSFSAAIMFKRMFDAFSALMSMFPCLFFGFRKVELPSFVTEFAILGLIQKINGNPVLSDLIDELIISSLMSSQNDTNKVINYLNQILIVDGYRVIRVDDYYRLEDLNGIYPDFSMNHEFLNEADVQYIREMIKKCEKKLVNEDFEGAITNARTLLESILINIESGLSSSKPERYDGDINRLFKRVRELLLESDSSLRDISENFKQMFSGISSVISSLASIRNAMSDSHAASIKPDKKLARLAVNISKTMADFLLEAYPYTNNDSTQKNEVIDIDSEEIRTDSKG